MNFSQDLDDHLDALTAGLDDGADLPSILRVLVDDLHAGITSFAGVSITLHTGTGSITLTALNSRRAATSLLLSLAPTTASTGGVDIVFYAGAPGAFVDLAADAGVAFAAKGNVVLDQHLPPPAASDSARHLHSLSQRSTIDQAIGFLTEQGYPPETALAELESRARAGDTTVARIASDLLGPGSGRSAATTGPR